MQWEPYLHKAQYYETDGMGIIHHSNYIRWFEEARVDFLAQIGMPFEQVEARGIVSPVIRVVCEYKTMARFGETVRIRTKDCFGNQIRTPEDELDSIDWDAINPATGPIFVEGAKAGGALKVAIDRIELDPQTASCTGKDEGVYGDRLDAWSTRLCAIEGDELETGSKEARAVLAGIQNKYGDDLEAKVADERYKYISANFSTAKQKGVRPAEAKRGRFFKNRRPADPDMTVSDRADRVLTHKIWSIPIFIVILFFVFHLTFSEDLFYINAIATAAGNPLPTMADLGHGATLGDSEIYSNFGIALAACFYDGAVFSPGVILTNLLNLVLNYIVYGIGLGVESAGAAEWAASLINDGIVGGITAVLGFLPQILTLFLFFSILEDTGYMARVAFILDRIFRRFGLSGRAFMPMIMGFGCSLPAMINTRTLADEKERTATIRVIPFFSCGAKLPILTAIAGGICNMVGFSNVDLITYSMYLLGIITAIVSVIIMRATTMRGEVPPFIMELPAYHVPGFKNLMLHLWDKTKHFVKKAFTIIFASTVLIWFLQSFGWNWTYLGADNMQQSILASVGQLIQPLFTPLGFGSQLNEYGWVFAVAAITGLIAKENVIATFSVLAAIFVSGFEGTEDGVQEAIIMIENTGITWPALIAFIMFNMTTIPCFAACATAKAELPKGKFGWTILFWLVTSYLVGAICYTVLSWWWTLFIWLVVAAAFAAVVILKNKGIIKLPKLGKRKRA